MPVRSPAMQTFRLRDFSGGPNLRDDQLEVAGNECLDAWNVTFDERGGVGSRLGYVVYMVSTGGFGAPTKNMHDSTTAAALITQIGASLYKNNDLTANKTFSTADRVGFADFAGKLCVIHPVDGLFTSTDGVTYTAVADPDAPKGDCLFPWQNKLFAAGNPTNPARVSWSVAGDPTNWVGTDFNDLREKDNEKVVALIGADGVDVATGKAGLIALKKRSTYRINDSASGAYVTVDANVGAANSISVRSVYGRVYALSEQGLWWTNGFSDMRKVSGPLDPLFTATQIDFSQSNLFAMGTRYNRLYFSLPRLGATANNISFEHDPTVGWMAPGSNAMACYATSLRNGETLYGGTPDTNGFGFSKVGTIFEMYKGGTDASGFGKTDLALPSVPIDSRFQTRWIDLAGGFQTQGWRLRVHGRGQATLAVHRDYRVTPSVVPVSRHTAQPVDSGGYNMSITDPAALQYDTGLLYDNGLLYSDPSTQGWQDFFSLGAARVFSIKVTASSSTSTNRAALLGTTAAGPEIGAWSIYGLDFSYVPLAVA